MTEVMQEALHDKNSYFSEKDYSDISSYLFWFVYHEEKHFGYYEKNMIIQIPNNFHAPKSTASHQLSPGRPVALANLTGSQIFFSICP
jgi:hypothetical protein